MRATRVLFLILSLVLISSPGSRVLGAPAEATGYNENTTVIEVPGPEGGVDCANAPLFQQDDGTFENGYAWSNQGVVAPDYGAWAECYDNRFVCEGHFILTQTGGQAGQTMDVYVWDDDGTGNPGNVICAVTDVDPGPIALWPSLSAHKVALNCCTPGPHFIGWWGNWPGQTNAWFIASDENGLGLGCPRTNVAPGIGYPTGWQHPNVVPTFALCQDLGLREWALPDCPLPPCQYPPGGPDWFDSWAHFTVNLVDPPVSFEVWLEGPTHVERGDPVLKGDTFHIDTQITQLDLTGVSCLGPMVVRQSSTNPSHGAIWQQDPSIWYPADSFFDVFIEIDVNGMTLHNEDALHMETQINSIPPYDDEYQGLGPVQLFDEQGNLVATIKNEVHIVHPPRDCFFSNGTFLDTFLGQIFLDQNSTSDVRRDAPLYNPDTNTWDVPIEMVSMDLRAETGLGPITIRQSPDFPSLGLVQQPGFDEFPAPAQLDLFIEIEGAGLPFSPLINLDPIPLTAVVNGYPPSGSEFFSGQPVTLFDKETKIPVSQLILVSHVPKEPFDWRPPPPPGRDCFCSPALVTVDFFQGPTTIEVLGTTMVDRQAAQPLPDGRVTIETEMVQMELTGNSPDLGDVIVRLSPVQPSPGQITQQQRGPLFPAGANFDVFFEIEVVGVGTFHNSLTEPLPMGAIINEIPPTASFQSTAPVLLFDENEILVGLLLDVIHGPLVPYDWQCPIPPPCLPGASSVEEPDQLPAPGSAFFLHPVRPNPTHDQATITFDLAQTSRVSVKVFDVTGREVQTVIEGTLEGGQRHQFIWDGRNSDGRTVDRGVYFVKLRTGDGQELSRKVLLLAR
jgi:hypothetical protein